MMNKTFIPHSHEEAARSILSLAVVLIAVLLAGFSIFWPATLMMGLVGGMYLAVPPDGAVPRSIGLLGGLIFIWCCFCFLPAIFLFPAFRQPLLGEGISLPWTLSAQPWISLEDMTLLFASFLWGWSCLDCKLLARHRESLICWFLFILSAVAVVSLLKGSDIGKLFPGYVRMVGQFQNRNQTGVLLLLGALLSLALGYREVVRERYEGVSWIVLSLFFFAAIVQNGSRGAVVLFILAVVIFLLRLPQEQGDRRNMLISVFSILLGAIVMFTSGGELGERFRELIVGGDNRIPIYEETGHLILQNFLFGVGLGDFEGVFNSTLSYIAGPGYRSIHPESDWLWIAAESGVPCLVLAAALGAEIIRLFFLRPKSSPFPELTRMGLTLALLMVLNGCWNVSGHLLTIFWPVLFVLSFGAHRMPCSTDFSVPKWVWRICGLVLIGICGLRIQSNTLNPWMPTTGSGESIEEAIARHPDLVTEKGLLDRGLAWAPLYWYDYYLRAYVCIQSPQLAKFAPGDFHRALFLERDSSDLITAAYNMGKQSPFPEGRVITDQVMELVSAHYKSLFVLIYNPDEDHLDARGLSAAANGDLNLATQAVILQKPENFDQWRQHLLKVNASLRGVPDEVSQHFFDQWEACGDVKELVSAWPKHPAWKATGWRGYVNGLAKEAQFSQAVKITLDFLPAPPMPSQVHPALEEAKFAFRSNPQDSFSGIQLYFAQKAADDQDEALDTLRVVLTLPKCPDYVPYSLALALHASHQDEEAWSALAKLVQKQ